MSGGLIVGVDVGGTKIAAALVAEDGSTGSVVQAPTPDGPVLTRAICDAVEAVLDGGSAASVGVSVAGFVRADRSTVALSPNIPGWAPLDLGADVRAVVGLPVLVENDANCAAWAEAVFGAARGSDNSVCLTVGTGLGGGIVLDRELYRGSSGFAAEFGHMTVKPNGRPCTCGRRGCWERYASGGALLRAYHELAPPDDLVRPGDGQTVNGADVTAAAQAGDPAALAAFSAVGAALGSGMAGLAAVLDVDTFVVGGGVADAGELLLQSVRKTYEDALPAIQGRPPTMILSAELKNSAGLVGAADLARRQFS